MKYKMFYQFKYFEVLLILSMKKVTEIKFNYIILFQNIFKVTFYFF
jgi:hypothetical protein